MRILFLSHYFPPEVNAPASRTFEHCREWVRAGHEVTVVTCAPNHPRGKVYDGYRNRRWHEETRDGIRVVRLWTWLAANEGFALRTLNYVSFMLASLVALPWLPRADVVISTSPQFFNGLAGYFVSRFRRIPWVLEIRDLWPESIVEVGALRNRAVIRVLQALELFAYRRADQIVALTDAFRRYIASRGIDPAKIEVIKNGCNLAFYAPSKVGNDLRSELGLEGKLVAAYFGTHGMAHRLETILEAAEMLRERHDLAFLIVGDGAERARLVQLRDERKLANVLMLGQQPKERMPALWRSCDVSLVLLKRSPLFRTVIPSKIFESLAMGRPVILGVEGESREIIEQSGAGIAFEPENAAALTQILLELRSDSERLIVMSQRGRPFVAENFDRVVLAQRFETLLADVVARSVTNRTKQEAPRTVDATEET